MSRNRALIFTTVMTISGSASFIATRLAATASQQAACISWLGNAPASVVQIENAFSSQADALIQTLLQAQNALGATIEDPCTPDATILSHVETVVAANENLLRRVGEHIAVLRLQLPAAQRQRLNELCADMFRGPLIRGGGGRRGPGAGGGLRAGRGPGGGFAYGGRGYGRGRGLGGGLAQSLRLTDEQVRLGQQRDPKFESDATGLRAILLAERANLLATFERPTVWNDDLLGELDKLILTHSQIERRVAAHVLALRPFLSPEQQKWLIGLCRRGRDLSASPPH